MKKLFRVALLIIVTIICNCAGPKINLRFNLEKGTTHKTRVTTEQKISQTVHQQQQIDVEQTIMMEYCYDILEVNEAGNTLIKITYDKIGYTQDGNMGLVEYKSWENPDPEEVPLLAKGYAALLDQDFTMEMSTLGEIIQIKGADEMIDAMLDDLNVPMTDEMKSQMEENMKNQFGDDAMSEMMQKTFTIYPERPVGVGDSWGSTLNIARGFPMVLKNNWKIKSIKDGKVYIDIHSKIEPNTEPNVMQMAGMQISYELSGEQKGYIAVDSLTGLVVEGKTEQKFEGMINLSGGMFAGSQDMSWPISILTTITIEEIKE